MMKLRMQRLVLSLCFSTLFLAGNVQALDVRIGPNLPYVDVPH